MKKCPFCAEEIQDAAVKCRFCGEFLNVPPRPPRLKWYFTTTFIVIAILSIGPLALPFVWWHPRYSSTAKWILTVLTLALTAVTVAATWGVFAFCWPILKESWDMLQSSR